jgi:C4-dicarboxylate transporter DctM subunit
MILILLVSLAVGIFVINTPIAFAIGLSSMVAVLMGNLFLGETLNYSIFAQRLFSGPDSFVLICIPFFILAGEIMGKGAIGKRLLDFCGLFVGRIRGGLAQVDITSSMIISGITGSSAADASAIGGMIIPRMIKEGYGKDFTAAVSSAATTVGVIIPPSIPMVLYSVITGTSLVSLYLAGFAPGALFSLSMMITAYIISKRRGYPICVIDMSLREIASTVYKSVLAIFMPLIMIGGVLVGVFTATEGGAVAVFYGLIVEVFVYKEMKIRDLPEMLVNTVVGTGVMLFLLGNANLYGWLLTYDQGPQAIAKLITSTTSNPTYTMTIILVIYLILGCIMDLSVNLLMMVPVFMPVVEQMGWDPIYFGMVTICALSVGLVTPPYGMCLFVTTYIAEAHILDVSKELIPFIVAISVIVFLIAFFPGISLFLPRLLAQ